MRRGPGLVVDALPVVEGQIEDDVSAAADLGVRRLQVLRVPLHQAGTEDRLRQRESDEVVARIEHRTRDVGPVGQRALDLLADPHGRPTAREQLYPRCDKKKVPSDVVTTLSGLMQPTSSAIRRGVPSPPLAPLSLGPLRRRPRSPSP